jgi:hypothetical protein
MLVPEMLVPSGAIVAPIPLIATERFLHANPNHNSRLRTSLTGPFSPDHICIQTLFAYESGDC